MKHPSFKKFILFAGSMFFLLNLSAQNDTTATRKNSLAVNVNGLLAELFNNGYNSQSFLTYRRHFQKWNLRIGLGGYYNYTEIDGPDPDYFNSGQSRLGLRTGYERPLLKYKRWQGYAGIDGVAELFQYSNLSPYDNSVTRKRSGYTWSFGLSPLLGINFQINELIGVGLESSYDVLLQSGLTTDEYSFSGVVYQTVQEFHSGISTSYSSPLRLNLRVCF